MSPAEMMRRRNSFTIALSRYSLAPCGNCLVWALAMSGVGVKTFIFRPAEAHGLSLGSRGAHMCCLAAWQFSEGCVHLQSHWFPTASLQFTICVSECVRGRDCLMVSSQRHAC